MALYPRPTVGQWDDIYLTGATVDCPDCGQPMVLITLELQDEPPPPGKPEWQADWECRGCGHAVSETGTGL